jgi:2'-5' RNA ligase superfamily
MATRYGVFLRPDPLTCAAVTRISGQLRAQYGLVSAGAFPPHVTLAGSLPLAGPESELLFSLHAALAGVAPFPVRNHGLAWLNGGLIYDVHDEPPAELAATVDAVVRPLLGPASGLAADTFDRTRWRAHLSLGSHDLAARPDLHEEVEAYVRGLAVDVPGEFAAEYVALYRLEHESWSGAWWRAMEWEHVRSWRLGV